MLLHSSPLTPEEDNSDKHIVFSEPAEPSEPEEAPETDQTPQQQTVQDTESPPVVQQAEVLPKVTTPLVEMKNEDNLVYDPNYMLLQIQQIPFADSTPKGLIVLFYLADVVLALRQGDALERALTVLDSVPWVQPHKIGILYVDSAQTNLEQILANQVGSRRYHEVISSRVQ